MSVRNIAFGGDEIRIYSDTMVYEDGKPCGYCGPKVITANCFAVSGRGTRVVVEPLANALAGLLDLDMAEAVMRHEAQHEPASNYEITIAGWSERRSALAVIEFRVRPGETATARELHHGVSLAPSPGNLVLPAFLDDERMIRLAMAQYQTALKNDISCCIGGMLHRTRITRDGVTQDVAALFPDAERAAA